MTDSRAVAVKKPHISYEISGLGIATQQRLVRSPIWVREMNDQLDLHNLGNDHVTI